MVEGTQYRLWLKIRVGKLLGSQDSALTASVAGRTVMIETQSTSQPLSEASWLIMGCRGFETEEQASQFGEHLRRAVHLAGLSARVGVDAGDPGENRTVSWLNPEVLGIGEGKCRDLRLGPDVHGIVVLPDDGKTMFARLGSPSVRVRSNADHFVEALEEALPEIDALGGDSPSVRRAIRVLNLAEMSEDPIAKVALAVSTIEGLAADPPWTNGQKELIEVAARSLEQSYSDGEEAEQVIKAIRNVRRESIRQRVRNLLAANDLSMLCKQWDKLYARRSDLFHGRSGSGAEHRGDNLEQSELSALGQEAIGLCASIVLSIAKCRGIAVPGRANVHFPVE